MPDEAATDGVSESCFRTKRELDEGDEPRRALELARRGDPLGFRYLYLRYADNVYSYVCTLLHDDHEAEDVTQQVFTKLLTSLDKYRERSVPFSAWILRIARNAAIDQLRRNRVVLTDEVRGADDGLEEIVDERRRSLTDALQRLPAAQRQVVLLRHLAGLSPGEIAARLGKSEGSIHGLHHRGRRALRRELISNGSAPALSRRVPTPG
jgi:RNA polymerase sigma-70 factor (ECF subfamily)